MKNCYTTHKEIDLEEVRSNPVKIKDMQQRLKAVSKRCSSAGRLIEKLINPQVQTNVIIFLTRMPKLFFASGRQVPRAGPRKYTLYMGRRLTNIKGERKFHLVRLPVGLWLVRLFSMTKIVNEIVNIRIIIVKSTSSSFPFILIFH